MTAKRGAITVTASGNAYERLLIKTPLITAKDSIIALVDKYTKSARRQGDIIVVSERVVAITQGRSIPLDKIHPSWWARKLYPFVYDHPGGIGLRNPYTMQIAIQEAGLWRILLAGVVSGFTKPFGLRGVFYHLAGHGVNAIDGPTFYTLPPGNSAVTLGPKAPQQVAQKIEDKTGLGAVIIDANDYGVRVLASSRIARKAKLPLKQIFSDNPMGQAREQTPIVIVREKI